MRGEEREFGDPEWVDGRRDESGIAIIIGEGGGEVIMHRGGVLGGGVPFKSLMTTDHDPTTPKMICLQIAPG